MKIIVVGLNHKTAPVAIREKLAFDTTKTMAALRQLKNRFSQLAEFVLLSTCNRVELYSAASIDSGVTHKRLTEFLSEFHGIEPDDFKDFLYIYRDEDAVRHMLTVASSLDSMVVGEGQILGQVKESYRLACAARSTGKVLNRLFHCGFTAAKKVHANTSIAGGRVSVAGVAVELATQLFADTSSAKVVVIGAGEMGELLVQHLLHEGCRNITVVNRSFDRGLNMADKYGIAAQKWDQLSDQLINADIAIASATGQDYLFSKSSFRKIADPRRKGSLLIIDIAVPRNIEPAVNEIENVYLYSIDELSVVAEQNRKTREADVSKGMEIVYESAAEFMDWFKARDIGPLIGQMREKFAQISREELERFFVGPRQEASCKEVMEPMVKRIVNRLLHCVIKNVDVVAKEYGPSEAAKMVDGIVQHADEIISEQDNEEEAES
ncbi:MAG: glutamyl-tRNA reductase, partial [Planctomycetota bacterium]|jgi:glutamyl-tRNA reductase